MLDMAFVIESFTEKKLVRLNLGCGHDVRPGWINVDKFPSQDDVVQANFPELPFANDYAQEIALCHVLEHFGYSDGFTLVKEIKRVLAPSGTAYIEVPDIEWCMARFLESPEATGYTHPSGDYSTDHRWGLWAQAIWGDQHSDGLYHKWGYTAHRLLHLLAAAGFSGANVEFVQSHGVQCLAATAIK